MCERDLPFRSLIAFSVDNSSLCLFEETVLGELVTSGWNGFLAL